MRNLLQLELDDTTTVRTKDLYTHAVLNTFPKLLTVRICLTIKNFFIWWLFPLSSWPWCVIPYEEWCCKETLDASHSCRGQRFNILGCFLHCFTRCYQMSLTEFFSFDLVISLSLKFFVVFRWSYWGGSEVLSNLSRLIRLGKIQTTVH